MIPVIVAARNEERAIAACLDSLARTTLPIAIVVALDECTDATASIVAARGVRAIRASGGKVRAQQAALAASAPAPFAIFVDADIVVAPGTLEALASAMADPSVRVAVPAKHPLPPRRWWSPLAHVLHRYNARHATPAPSPAWFSGKLFAIRDFEIPADAELRARAAALPASAFYAYGEPLRVDDVYLSRRSVGAIRGTAGAIYFRAPETWRGMYRYYRRMRRELERIDRLFPELPATRDPPGRRSGSTMFDLALAACRLAYRAERCAVDRLGVSPRNPWPAIER